jgi:putative ubiquitin-RnfH superfamily antitoxin RatB of RatAB toxin-antitoxin module
MKISESVAAVGVWGKVRPLDFALRDGDRVELYRPLQADPKDARRDKARQQSGRTKHQ